jgi:cell division protein FtsQ
MIGQQGPLPGSPRPQGGARRGGAGGGQAAAAGQAAPGGGRSPVAPGSAGSPMTPGRKADPWKTAFFGVMALAIVAGVAWALLGSSLLVVRSVQAAGTPLVSRSRILAAAGISPGTPLIRINTAVVERRIDQITQVQSARVSRDWPDKVVILVQDRVPALAVAAGGRFALVDEFGVIVQWAGARPPGMPLLRSPGAPATSLRGSAAVRAAVAVVHQLPASLRRRLVAVRAPAANAVEVILQGRITVVWGSPSRAAAKARELAALMRTNASYYDVSDPGTAVTRG